MPCSGTSSRSSVRHSCPGWTWTSGRRGFSSAVALPGDRHTLVIGGFDQGVVTEMTVVLDLGTMVFTPGHAMAARHRGSAVVVLSVGSRTLVVGGFSEKQLHLID